MPTLVDRPAQSLPTVLSVVYLGLWLQKLRSRCRWDFCAALTRRFALTCRSGCYRGRRSIYPVGWFDAVGGTDDITCALQR